MPAMQQRPQIKIMSKTMPWSIRRHDVRILRGKSGNSKLDCCHEWLDANVRNPLQGSARARGMKAF